MEKIYLDTSAILALFDLTNKFRRSDIRNEIKNKKLITSFLTICEVNEIFGKCIESRNTVFHFLEHFVDIIAAPVENYEDISENLVPLVEYHILCAMETACDRFFLCGSKEVSSEIEKFLHQKLSLTPFYTDRREMILERLWKLRKKSLYIPSAGYYATQLGPEIFTAWLTARKRISRKEIHLVAVILNARFPRNNPKRDLKKGPEHIEKMIASFPLIYGEANVKDNFFYRLLTDLRLHDKITRIKKGNIFLPIEELEPLLATIPAGEVHHRWRRGRHRHYYGFSLKSPYPIPPQKSNHHLTTQRKLDRYYLLLLKEVEEKAAFLGDQEYSLYAKHLIAELLTEGKKIATGTSKREILRETASHHLEVVRQNGKFVNDLDGFLESIQQGKLLFDELEREFPELRIEALKGKISLYREALSQTTQVDKREKSIDILEILATLWVKILRMTPKESIDRDAYLIELFQIYGTIAETSLKIGNSEKSLSFNANSRKILSVFWKNEACYSRETIGRIVMRSWIFGLGIRMQMGNFAEAERYLREEALTEIEEFARQTGGGSHYKRALLNLIDIIGSKEKKKGDLTLKGEKIIIKYGKIKDEDYPFNLFDRVYTYFPLELPELGF